MKPVDVPGNTVADKEARLKIRDTIIAMEQIEAPKCKPEIIGTKVVGMEGNDILEEWTVQSCDDQFVYPVRLRHLETGKIEFSVIIP